MAGLSGSRKRQSRLAFTPLPSSSPAASGYNKQIQDRAAAVSLDSPAKRRKLTDGTSDGQLDGANDDLPTPAASLQHTHQVQDDMEDSQNDSEPIRSTQRRQGTQSSKKSRQQQVDFSGARHPDTFSSPLKLSSSARPQSSGGAGIFGTQRRPVVHISSDDSDEHLPSPAQLMAKRKSKKGLNSSSRKTRSKQQPIQVDSESEGDNITLGNRPSSVVAEESEEDDDMPTTIGKQRRKRTRRASQNSFVSSSPLRIVDNDDDLEVTEQPRKRHRHGHDDDERDSEDDAVTPSRRSLKRHRQASQREQEDLEEDLDFLGPSSDVENSARMPRNTQTAQKDARQKALQRLKRRRSGQPIVVEDDPDEDEKDELIDEEDESQEEVDESEEVLAPPISSRQMFNEDEGDEEFIDEEDEDANPLGIPDGLPLEFSRYASMKNKELFPYAVEWMVQKKLNPTFQMDDEIYVLTFRKLDDEVRGLAASKFKSAAWTPAFTMALNSRPDIAYEPIDRSAGEHYLRDTCDACNRTNHPATYQIQFQGTPYHRSTLEEVDRTKNDDDEDDISSDETDADDEPAYDDKGSEIPPANRIYYVGKFCMSNAQTAHALQHWRYHLNEWVATWLIRNGYDTPEKNQKRSRWSSEKRRKNASKIVDRMEHDGVVKTLWQDFRSNIDEARNSKQGRYRFDSP